MLVKVVVVDTLSGRHFASQAQSRPVCGVMAFRDAGIPSTLCARRITYQYIVELPARVLLSTSASATIAKIKLQRKRSGILEIRCIHKDSKMFSSRDFYAAYYFIVTAVDSESACIAIWNIDSILYQMCGLRIDCVLQRVTCAAARYIFLRLRISRILQWVTCAVARYICLHDIGNFHFDIPSQHPLLMARDGKEAALVYGRGPRAGKLQLVRIVQRFFELNGVNCELLPHVKFLVWQFLGGSTFDLSCKLRSVGDLFTSIIVARCWNFHYAMPISIRMPHQERSALQIVEDCGVALWLEHYSCTAFVGNLQICGPIHAVRVALERLRAVRASAYPEHIVIREAFADDSLAQWRLAFGEVSVRDIVVFAKRLDCFLDEVHGESSRMKQIIKSRGMVVFQWNYHMRGISLVGEQHAVANFLTCLPSQIQIGDSVQVRWKDTHWKAVVFNCFQWDYCTYYEVRDPRGSWGPWLAPKNHVQKVLALPLANPLWQFA